MDVFLVFLIAGVLSCIGFFGNISFFALQHAPGHQLKEVNK